MSQEAFTTNVNLATRLPNLVLTSIQFTSSFELQYIRIQASQILSFVRLAGCVISSYTVNIDAYDCASLFLSFDFVTSLLVSCLAARAIIFYGSLLSSLASLIDIYVATDRIQPCYHVYLFPSLFIYPRQKL